MEVTVTLSTYIALYNKFKVLYFKMPNNVLTFEVRNMHLIHRTDMIAVISSIHHVVLYSYKTMLCVLSHLRFTTPYRCKTSIKETLRYESFAGS